LSPRGVLIFSGLATFVSQVFFTKFNIIFPKNEWG